MLGDVAIVWWTWQGATEVREKWQRTGKGAFSGGGWIGCKSLGENGAPGRT